MGLVAMGVALLGYSVGLSTWLARRLRRDGRNAAPPWRLFARAGSTWMGLIFIALSIDDVAAGMLMLVALGLAVVQILRGVREFPRVWREVGDPAAWRGSGDGL